MAALEGNARARSAFGVLNKTDRYQVIVQLLRVRTLQTRATRLQRAIAALEGE